MSPQLLEKVQLFGIHLGYSHQLLRKVADPLQIFAVVATDLRSHDLFLSSVNAAGQTQYHLDEHGIAVYHWPIGTGIHTADLTPGQQFDSAENDAG
jgi:hypothetical protein